MGRIFDDDGKVKNRADLLSIAMDGRRGTYRKVTDESSDKAFVQRVESDSERSLNINPRTVDFKVEAK